MRPGSSLRRLRQRRKWTSIFLCPRKDARRQGRAWGGAPRIFCARKRDSVRCNAHRALPPTLLGLLLSFRLRQMELFIESISVPLFLSLRAALGGKIFQLYPSRRKGKLPVIRTWQLTFLSSRERVLTFRMGEQCEPISWKFRRKMNVWNYYTTTTIRWALVIFIVPEVSFALQYYGHFWYGPYGIISLRNNSTAIIKY